MTNLQLSILNKAGISCSTGKLLMCY